VRRLGAFRVDSGRFGLSGDSLVVADDRLYSINPGYGSSTVGIQFTDGGPLDISITSPFCTSGAALGGRLLAAATTGGLLLVDGTAPIVTLHPGSVRSLEPDPDLQQRSAIFPVSRELAYFVVGEAPAELWRTDGTIAGTTLVQQLEVLDGAAVLGNLYLTVDDPQAGIEPFVLRPPVFNMPVGDSCSGHPTGTHTLRTDVDPRIGRTVQIVGRSRVEGAGSGQVAGIFLGSAAPAPVFLGPSKCTFRVDLNRPIAAITAPITQGGDFSASIQIPQLPVFVGAEIMLQALVAPSPSPIGVDVTNGLFWVVGN
jgi:hypothetical protein